MKKYSPGWNLGVTLGARKGQSGFPDALILGLLVGNGTSQAIADLRIRRQHSFRQRPASEDAARRILQRGAAKERPHSKKQEEKELGGGVSKDSVPESELVLEIVLPVTGAFLNFMPYRPWESVQSEVKLVDRLA